MSETEPRVARRTGRRPSPPPVADAPGSERARAYRHLQNPFEPLRVFSDDQVAAIHEAALRILATQGTKVLSADARQRYRAGGAELDEATPVSYTHLTLPTNREV